MLTVRSFGPFLGVQDGRNTALDAAGILRHARQAVLSGFNRLRARNGTEVAITLMDDAGTPAACTSVCYVGQFTDYVLAIGHSTATDKAYVYLLAPDLSGWYSAAGALTTAATATPLGVLWTSIPEAPVVTVAELLGTAYIAHNAACDAAAFYYETRTLELVATTWTLANLTGDGNPCYFLGVAAFQGHLLGWGFDFGTVAATSYRPELLRFGAPDGGAIDGTGSASFTVGHRVRSARERINNITVAADVAYMGTPFSLWPLIGYGRDSWDKSQPVDDSFGITGPLAACSANGVLYYWSSRGPARCVQRNKPDPLWDAIPETVAAIIDPQKVVVAFDADVDQVLFFHRAGALTGNQLICAYDIRREKFVTADTDIGIPVACAQLVSPVLAASSSGATPPAGPPTNAVTSEIFQGSVKAAWTNGDTSIQVTTIVEYRLQAGPGAWVQAGIVGPGVSELTFDGLSPSTAYEWRVYHRRFGFDSAALGPSAPTQFTTTTTCRAPSGLSLTSVDATRATAEWTNSIESGVSTRIEVSTFPVTTWSDYAVAGPGVSSYSINIYSGVGESVRITHTKSGLTASSALTAGPPLL